MAQADGCPDYDILYARSTDNGVTWTDPAALNTNAATDTGDDTRPQVTTDGAGNWIAVWESRDDLSSVGGAIGTDYDILYAVSSPPTPTPTLSPSPSPTSTPSPTPSPTSSPTPTPTPSATATAGQSVTWGDANCSSSVGPIDSLLTLRHDASTPATVRRWARQSKLPSHRLTSGATSIAAVKSRQSIR